MVSCISCRASTKYAGPTSGRREETVSAKMRESIIDRFWADAEIVWEYHRLRHRPRACDAAVALGCNDLSVAAHAAALYHRGLFPVVVFSGANSRETFTTFSRGESTHYREHAL